MHTQKIAAHLWFDTEAHEAVQFYTGIFKDSKILATTQLRNTPGGDSDLIWFTLSGFPFLAINGGPVFKPNRSISFFVNFDPLSNPNAKHDLDLVYAKLMEGGREIEKLGSYPFSEHYAWVEDRYGVSWRLILTKAEGEVRPSIIPCLQFSRKVYKRAEEAANRYVMLFDYERMGNVVYRPDGSAMFLDFMIAGTWMAALDNPDEKEPEFNEGISLMIYCDTQEQIDHFWNSLSADPDAEACGWLKDRYGVSWQITPSILDKMLINGTRAQIDALTQVILPMKKLDLALLEKTFKIQQ